MSDQISNSAGTTAISLRDISKRFLARGGPATTALEKISLDVQRREFAVITGRSGSGKTTLLNIASGILRPDSGEVLVEGTPLWTRGDAERSEERNRSIGFIFQFPSLLESLDLLENVALPAGLSGRRGDSAEARRRALELLERVGLSERAKAYPRQLSKGQQQRAVIARALLTRPRMLFADESTSDLDEESEAEVMGLLRRIHADDGLTVVMVTHNPALVRESDRRIRLEKGRIKEEARS